ncbi:hypothetical protein V2J09_011347, partial [Rumex salicifolius]
GKHPYIKELNRKSSRVHKSSIHVKLPFTTGKKRPCMPPRHPYSFYEYEDRKNFYDWFKDGNKDGFVEGLELRLSKDFFIRLILKGCWLGDIHINEILCHLRKHKLEAGDTFKDVRQMKGTFRTFTKAMLLVEPPGHYEKSWSSEVTRIFMPFNVENEHWVGLEVDLVKKHLTILDSIINLYKEEVLNSLVELVCNIVPLLLKLPGNFSHLGLFEDVFTFNRDQCLPHDVGENCGLYTIKFIEARIFGGKLDDLDEVYVKAHREKLSIELFNQKIVWKPGPEVCLRTFLMTSKALTYTPITMKTYLNLFCSSNARHVKTRSIVENDENMARSIQASPQIFLASCSRSRSSINRHLPELNDFVRFINEACRHLCFPL